MKRARAPEQKAQRRATILHAAEVCYHLNAPNLPSVADVAAQAGVSKGTVYLYFHTKEEIFLALYSFHLNAIFKDIQQVDVSENPTLALTDALLQYVTLHPIFMPLAGMLHSVLESNLSLDVLLNFKLQLSQGLTHTATKLDHKLNSDAGFSERALLHSYAALTGLWQLLQWPSALAHEQGNPQFGALHKSFEEELRLLLRNIWRID
ncbi:TetR family transcriptional regulator [Reinekea marina]|uniref:TetR family transcriptional regulator n=1 Tax=Reinekea marina TaxID=1310421 RepID=A0ABV7WT50_9GAMM